MSVDIRSDGKTVWVNSDQGMCIGRFSRFGIDVHHDYETQARGCAQCLECAHGEPDADGWRRFCALMLEHYGVEVPDKYKPRFLK